MLNTDADAFDAVMQDLCLAFNRPHTVELTRVYWESLKNLRIDEVRRAAMVARNALKKFPTPKDLTPERSAPPPVKDPIESERWSTWAVAANKILLAVAYQDVNSRGFKPMGEPMLQRVLAIKHDYVQMAEQAEAHGDRWEPEDFNRMCREGFQKLLGSKEVA
jgi:hypothetical protein